MAHRLVYTLIKGEIPEGLVLDHGCKNRRCCNTKHLEPVTQKVNVERGDAVLFRKPHKPFPALLNNPVSSSGEDA